MDVHPRKNVSIGIDPYPYDFIVVEWGFSEDFVWESLWIIWDSI